MQRSRERLLEFLFPAGTDNWLAVLRVGLGFQVTFYSLSLRNDWNYLLFGAGADQQSCRSTAFSRQPFRSEIGMARCARHTSWPA